MSSGVSTSKKLPQVVIYTDGACAGNPGWGGWGALLRSQHHEKRLCDGQSSTTNNRMELTAAIEALKALKTSCSVKIYTDSQYVRQGITQWLAAWQRNGWKTANRKEVKNRDLWMQLLEHSAPHAIEWHWVKGHAGNEGNETADELARQGMEAARSKMST